MIDLQLCCVSIQRNKLEFGIILSSYIIMRTVPVTLLFQFIRLLHCSHCIRSVLWASECERSRFRLHFVRFLYYLCASLFLMIFLLFAFIHSPRFFSESDLRELVFSFHQKENKHKHFFVVVVFLLLSCILLFIRIVYVLGMWSEKCVPSNWQSSATEHV